MVSVDGQNFHDPKYLSPEEFWYFTIPRGMQDFVHQPFLSGCSGAGHASLLGLKFSEAPPNQIHGPCLVGRGDLVRIVIV